MSGEENGGLAAQEEELMRLETALRHCHSVLETNWVGGEAALLSQALEHMGQRTCRLRQRVGQLRLEAGSAQAMDGGSISSTESLGGAHFLKKVGQKLE